jgi:hypothetical protein
MVPSRALVKERSRGPLSYGQGVQSIDIHGPPRGERPVSLNDRIKEIKFPACIAKPLRRVIIL